MRTDYIIKFSAILISIFLAAEVFAGTTGKITGIVTDKETGEPLIGVNLILEGKSIGAATDIDGYYAILNIPPGDYILKASMIGYNPVRITNIRITADKTTQVNVELSSKTETLNEEIIISAKRPVIQQDLTSSELSVTSKEIENLPVEQLNDILQLKAGVVKDAQGGIHIRGGRSSEVGYLVDGIQVNDNYSGGGGANVDVQFMEEVKVISGVFNAEYGQAMSGVVEVITKEGSDKFEGNLSISSGDYLSSNKNIFMNIDEFNPASISDIKGSVSGPIKFGDNKLSYNLAFRRFENEGWLFGKRRFNPADSSYQEGTGFHIHESGDNEVKSLNSFLNYNIQAKVNYGISDKIKLSNLFLYDNSESQFYNHLYKYNPDGLPKNYNYSFNNIFSGTYIITNSTFFKLKYSYSYSENKTYVHENLMDSKYSNPELLRQLTAYSFYTGGTAMEHIKRTNTKHIIKADIFSQVNRYNEVKAGIEINTSKIKPQNNLAYYNGEPSKVFNDNYYLNQGEFEHTPTTIAAYIQDKLEYKSVIINAGIRYDYFDSNGKVPSDLKDPANSEKKDADIQHQFSPRLGIAFPISADGTIHFSYGHFFQIPPLEYLYTNPNFRILPNGTRTLMGNANLKAQSTVAYEVGIHYKFFDMIGLEVIGYYKDISDLLGTEIRDSYIKSDRYALYTNRDYGKTKGVTISLSKRPINDNISVTLDYTLQVSESNASDPKDAFNRSQGTPPKKPNVQIIPVDWDQQHTINFSLFYIKPNDFSLGLIAKYESGFPYTPENQSLEASFENSDRMPNKTNIDIQFNKEFNVGGNNLSFFVKVFNLLDSKNETNVYRDTGRAGYSLISQYNPEYQGPNGLSEFLVRPDFYSEPRRVLVGVSYNFSF